MNHTHLARAAALFDDPIIVDWAIYHYSKLPPESPRREQLTTLWFDDANLERWVDEGDLNMLSLLLCYLPAERFASFAPTIASRWSEWPATMADAGARILARVAPDLAAEVFARYLQTPQPWSVERAAAILHRLDQLPLTAALPLAEKLIPLAWSGDTMHSWVLGNDAFRAAVKLNQIEALPRLLDSLFSKQDYRLDGAVESVAYCLFGHASYAELFLLQQEDRSLPSVDQLATLFEDDAPISEMAAVMSLEAPLDRALSLLAACHDRSPGAALAWGIIQRSEAYRTRQHPVHLAALTLAAVAAACERKTIDTAKLPLDAVVSLLALDVRTNIHFAQVVERLKSFPRDETAAAMLRQLADCKDTCGSVHLASAMGQLAWPEFTQALLGCMGDDDGDFLCEAAQMALVAIGEPARDAVIRQWETLDDSQQIYGASAIAAIGGQAVADFTLSHSEQLLNEDLERWCSLALAAPDQRLLERLRRELDRNQSLINETCYRLCRLLDVSCPELDDLRTKIMQRRKQQQDRQALFDRACFPAPGRKLHLALRCPACRAVNSYDVKGVAIGDPDKDQMLLADEIACLSCGEFTEFEFEPEAKITLLAEALLLQAAASTGKQNSAGLIINDRMQSPDGSRQSIPSCYAGLQQKVRRTPEDWRSWFRLSNVLRHINRPKAALACLQKAHALNPLSLDTLISLAELLMDSGHPTEAFDLLDAAQKDSSRWQTFSDRPIEKRGEFTQLFNELRRKLGLGYSAAPPSATISQAPKVGRNDPCPCGSGKKFKKCCMG